MAEIDCAVGHGGKELLTARLRKPDGFRGTPIFADDRGYQNSQKTPSSFEDLNPDSPCQIYPDPLDSTGRVFVLKILDFGKCGVLKRDVREFYTNFDLAISFIEFEASGS